jgi:hypothetical protein
MRSVNVPGIIPSLVGSWYKGSKRQLKKGMHGNSTCINGCYTCWGYNRHFFKAIIANVSEEGGFTRSCFTGKENVPVGLVHKTGSELKKWVRIIWQCHGRYTFWKGKEKNKNGDYWEKKGARLTLKSANDQGLRPQKAE